MLSHVLGISLLRSLLAFLCLCFWYISPASAHIPKGFKAAVCIGFHAASAEVTDHSKRIIKDALPYPALIEVVFIAPINMDSSANEPQGVYAARLEVLRGYLSSLGLESKRIRAIPDVVVSQETTVPCRSDELQSPAIYIEFLGWCSSGTENPEACRR